MRNKSQYLTYRSSLQPAVVYNFSEIESILPVRSSHPVVYRKKELLEIFQNSQENTCARALACNLIEKETLAQVFSCEFCEICERTFSYRTPPMAAFVQCCSKIYVTDC